LLPRIVAHAVFLVTFASVLMRLKVWFLAGKLIDPCTPDLSARHYVSYSGNFSLCAVIAFHPKNAPSIVIKRRKNFARPV
jgi:hypothetical protein